MTSQEDTQSTSSPPPPPSAGTANLASKFQRKAKFRRASVGQLDMEYIPGLSNTPGGVDSDGVNTKETLADAPVPAPVAVPATTTPPASADSDNDSGALLVSVLHEHAPTESAKRDAPEAEVASETGMNKDHTTTTESGATVHSPSRSRSPKVETKTPVLSPDSSQHVTSPPESTKQDDDVGYSISSSPQRESTLEGDAVPPPGETSESDFIRPFSPEELDQAKSLVLDLLGWGVEPEFLVASGVSAEAIYRIFTDLNLRLPNNLEVSEDVKAVAYSWGPIPASGDSNSA
ncbi:hypothetical protein CVT25_008539 [Psilocybe cyanescens]|uniref:Uncharacterized protein n=1 Tax=Psilocybe cyanescens TaxID=93625 RepID=A0A409XA24_PSICY|nr:hypothetical protein CVT25_008539 [Psilocybe cyanescens]